MKSGGETEMGAAPSRVATHTPIHPDRKTIHQHLGALVELLACHPNGTLEPVSESLEEILLDMDLCGHRYLLIRMSLLGCSRVHLSPREQEIVRMVAKGHPNKVIADVLNISSWTVCTHLRRIFAKLGVTSRAAMVAHLLETEICTEVTAAPNVGDRRLK
jgi:DNA-binding CsgD family transcriptional regulator